MARKPDLSGYQSFDQIANRLDEIVGQVRDKDTSLERSLDLFDEAIALGSKAVEMVDNPNFSAAELERMNEEPAGEAVSQGTAAAEAGSATKEH